MTVSLLDRDFCRAYSEFMAHEFTNALAKETSPYLLQHAHNPVEWYPWSEEALSRAKKEDKPILLSVGYSACHWCHVMERESFENEEIAGLMNRYFINIKVDREERPDLDTIYMNVVQIMTGSGGWPMTVFLTPEQVPFFSGTYFPPQNSHGRPGFRQVLEAVARAYREKKEILAESGRAIINEMEKLGRLSERQEDLKPEILETAVSGIISAYDPRYGGFGHAPKFPPSMALEFLMRSYRRNGDPALLEIIENTLTHMAFGGIFDQIGGGFHRYSVDAEWLVPHFEKMLYDNALLGRVYLNAWLLTGKDLHRRIAEETLDYVLREMTSPEGGFYSSQDADTEGKEGAFFLWTQREVESILDKEDAALFCRYFGITPAGNFEGSNILHIPDPSGEALKRNDIPDGRMEEIIRNGRRRLFEARERRVKPLRDEKILTAWNGLMLRSFAEAANSLGREDYRQAAVRNAEFLASELQPDGRLLRSYKDGRARFNGYLDDYACLLDGLLSLYEADFNPRWIRDAQKLADRMIEEFWDDREGGFFYTSKDHESLIHRPKEFYDSAVPSGNSVSVHALLKLGKLTGDTRREHYPAAVLKRMALPMRRSPAAFANLLCALDFHFGKPKEIVIAGDPAAAKTRVLLDAIFQTYFPNKVVACGSDENMFLLKGKSSAGGMPTAYVCENFTCREPVTTPEDLRRQLNPEP